MSPEEVAEKARALSDLTGERFQEKKRMFEKFLKENPNLIEKEPENKSGLISEDSKFDNVVTCVKTIKNLYPPVKNGDLAKNCLNTIKVIINNIIKNPNEDKYKKMKLENKNLKEMVLKLEEGKNCLFLLGFKEDGEYLVLANLDNDLLNKSLNLLEKELK